MGTYWNGLKIFFVNDGNALVLRITFQNLTVLLVA